MRHTRIRVGSGFRFYTDSVWFMADEYALSSLESYHALPFNVLIMCDYKNERNNTDIKHLSSRDLSLPEWLF